MPTGVKGELRDCVPGKMSTNAHHFQDTKDARKLSGRGQILPPGRGGTLIFQPPEQRQNISVILSPPVCGTGYSSPVVGNTAVT